jgi:hypothetical protein
MDPGTSMGLGYEYLLMQAPTERGRVCRSRTNYINDVFGELFTGIILPGIEQLEHRSFLLLDRLSW